MTIRSIDARRCTTVDGDRVADDVAALLRAQEHGERGDLLRLALTADAALRERFLAQILDRPALRRGALLQQHLRALGRGGAGMDDVDVDSVTKPELGQALGEARHRGV